MPIETHDFDKEQDGPPLFVDGKGSAKTFFDTAKFNPRQLIEMADVTDSSCNEAEDEAHLPEI